MEESSARARIVGIRQKNLNKTVGEWEDENKQEWPNSYPGAELHAEINGEERTLDPYQLSARVGYSATLG